MNARLPSALAFAVCFACVGPNCIASAPGGSSDAPEPALETGAQDGDDTVVSDELVLGADDHVLYQLAWSWEGARWDEGAGGYVFETDLGYTVTLEAGYVSTISLQLVPCEEDEASPQTALFGFGPVDRAVGALSRWLAIPSAQADHDYEDDSSLVEAPMVESMIDGKTRELGVGHSSGQRYCQAHTISASLAQSAADGFAMDGESIALRGRYLVPGEDEPHTFEASVNLGAGALRELTAIQPGVAPYPLVSNADEAMDARVVLERTPARALDGEALEALTEAELAYEFLKGLNASARVRWELSPYRPGDHSHEP